MKNVTDVIGSDYLNWGKPLASIVCGHEEPQYKNNTSKWSNTNSIIINAPTGSGKTYFVLNRLLPHALENNKTVAYFTNRTTLKEQLLSDLKNKSDTEKRDYANHIVVVNYQELCGIMNSGEYEHSDPAIKRQGRTAQELAEFIRTADYLILDEAHYFISDCDFNDSINACTDVLIDLRYNNPQAVWIFMTATTDYLGLWLIYFFARIEEQSSSNSIQTPDKNKKLAQIMRYINLPAVPSSEIMAAITNQEKNQCSLFSYKTLNEILLGQYNDEDIIRYIPHLSDTLDLSLFRHLPSYLTGSNQNFFSDLFEIYKKDIGYFLKSFTQYIIKPDYSYINVVYYRNYDNLLEATEHTPQKEKWLVFTNSEQEGHALNDSLREANIESAFLTSNNKRKMKRNGENVCRKIADSKTYADRVLIATKVIDNGVSLNDPSIKHIVLDTTNKTTFLQMLGRKRIRPEKNETINLYLRDISQGQFMQRLKRETLDFYLFCHQFPSCKEYHRNNQKPTDYQKWFIHSCFDKNTIILEKYRRFLYFSPDHQTTISPHDPWNRANLLSTYALNTLPMLKTNWDALSILSEIQKAWKQRYSSLTQKFARDEEELKNRYTYLYDGKNDLLDLWNAWRKADDKLIEEEHLWLKIQQSWIGKATEENDPTQLDHWYTEVLGIRKKYEAKLKEFFEYNEGYLDPGKKADLQDRFCQYSRTLHPWRNTYEKRSRSAINEGLAKWGWPYHITTDKGTYFGKYGTYWIVERTECPKDTKS